MGDDPKVGERSCDEQREELQEAFKKAYIATRELKKEARERSVDQTCIEMAETKRTTELTPLVSVRESTVEKISVASQAIAALEPVLALVKDKVEKLETHIKKTLTPECETAGEASKMLIKVRELIISMEKCPGRNDFKLKVPSADEKLPEEPEDTQENEAPAPKIEEPPQETGKDENSLPPKIEEPLEETGKDENSLPPKNEEPLEETGKDENSLPPKTEEPPEEEPEPEEENQAPNNDNLAPNNDNLAPKNDNLAPNNDNNSNNNNNNGPAEEPEANNNNNGPNEEPEANNNNGPPEEPEANNNNNNNNGPPEEHEEHDEGGPPKEAAPPPNA